MKIIESTNINYNSIEIPSKNLYLVSENMKEYDLLSRLVELRPKSFESIIENEINAEGSNIMRLLIIDKK
jgi:hypothetical protein